MGSWDERLMRQALALAEAGLGATAPNPSVGCVVARGDAVLAMAATGAGGRPHAEEQALAAAGSAARGATAYVTLEPCNQRSGGGASCTDLLIRAGLARVVFGSRDPHPLAAGVGPARLAEAGIEVEAGFLAADADRLNAGFFSVVRDGRPLVAFADGPSGFDARFDPAPDADLGDALRALARAGLTRLYTNDAALAARLLEAGLLDPGFSPPRPPA